MVQLDLTIREQTLLRQVLENTLSDLRMEIAQTDSEEFREMLKGRRQLLEKVLAALESASAV